MAFIVKDKLYLKILEIIRNYISYLVYTKSLVRKWNIPRKYMEEKGFSFLGMYNIKRKER
jgi:hypothetical protein